MSKVVLTMEKTHRPGRCSLHLGKIGSLSNAAFRRELCKLPFTVLSKMVGVEEIPGLSGIIMEVL